MEYTFEQNEAYHITSAKLSKVKYDESYDKIDVLASQSGIMRRKPKISSLTRREIPAEFDKKKYLMKANGSRRRGNSRDEDV